MPKIDVSLVLIQERPEVNLREWVDAAQGLAQLRAGRSPMLGRGHLIRNARQREKLAANFRRDPPNVVFVLVGREQVPGALAFLNLLQDLPKSTYVVVGGSYGTLCSYEFTASPAVRAVVLGEWVEALAELADSLVRSNTGADINGVWWKGAKGWQLAARRSYDPDLATWPHPSIDDFRAREILRLQAGRMPIHASRGFPFNTLFNPEPLLRHLQISEAYYHVRPAALVVEDAKQLAARYEIRQFEFVDFIFPWDAEWTAEFARIWAKEVARPFLIRSAADHMTREHLTPLKEAGLAQVRIDLESGNDVLRARLSDLNKTNQLVREAIERCRRMKIATHVVTMLGLPYETTRTIRETVELAKELKADKVGAELYLPWPESAHWTDTERSITGGHCVARPRIKDIPQLRRDAIVAINEILMHQSLQLAGRHRRRASASFDGLSDFPHARFRSPLEGAVRVTTFNAPSGEQTVIAARVPCEVTWSTNVPNLPMLEFGILLEPALPGERSRLPISFSIKVTQDEKTFRMFQKVLIQALDPDSRRWHWFKLPLTTVHPGPAELTLENVVYGKPADYVPEEDLWAGWARLAIISQETSQERSFQAAIDYEDEEGSVLME